MSAFVVGLFVLVGVVLGLIVPAIIAARMEDGYRSHVDKAFDEAVQRGTLVPPPGGTGISSPPRNVITVVVKKGEE